MDGYRVTRHEGRSATSATTGTVLHTTSSEVGAWQFYSLTRPPLDTVVAVWRPDGSLIASKSGPRRDVR
jgi:hypothetical protein